MKSYQNEIQHLKQKLESNKLEMQLKNDEYSKQITNLSDELTSKRVNWDSKVHYSRIEDSAIDDDSLSQNIPIYTSHAEFLTSKTITIPSHDSSAMFVSIENEDETQHVKEIQEKQEMQKEKIDQSTETEREVLKSIREEREMQEILEKLNEQLEKTQMEKSNIEKQLITIYSELKQYQNDNLSLSNKYENQVTYLNEQLQAFQVIVIF